MRTSGTISAVMKMLCRSKHLQITWAQLYTTDQVAHGQGGTNRPGLMASMNRFCRAIRWKISSPFEVQNQDGVLFDMLMDDE